MHRQHLRQVLQACLLISDLSAVLEDLHQLLAMGVRLKDVLEQTRLACHKASAASGAIPQKSMPLSRRTSFCCRLLNVPKSRRSRRSIGIAVQRVPKCILLHITTDVVLPPLRVDVREVDMDVGGGVIVPFTVAEDTDLEAVTAEVVPASYYDTLASFEYQLRVTKRDRDSRSKDVHVKSESAENATAQGAEPGAENPPSRGLASLAALLGAFLAGSLLASAGDAFASTINQKYTAQGKYIPKKYRRWKPTVVLLQDHPKLGKKGDVVTVKKGYYRNILYPEGVAKRQDASIMNQLEREAREKSKEAAQELAEAMKRKEAVEKHGPFVFEKKVREDRENIYGSLSQINVAEEIVKATAVPVRQVSVQIPKITKVGTYRGTIEFLPEVIAVLEIKVVPEGYQEEGEEGEEGEEEEASE
ncbi:rplI [Symbiodinium sp. CCMP2592]|nr:rplI [Symbiodinium sp. CCMP2592]